MPDQRRSYLERQLSIAHNALWRAAQHASLDRSLEGAREDLTDMAAHVQAIHTSLVYGAQHPGQTRLV